MISRAAAQTVNELVARVRRELDDPAFDGAGNEIPVASRRFNDEEILSAINDQLVQMGTVMALNHPGEALVHVDHVYIEDTGDIGDELPDGIDAEGILKVEDITDPSYPTELFYIHNLDEASVGVRDSSLPIHGSYRRFFTLTASASPDTTYRIKVRPIPDGRTLRISYVATPFVVAAETDAPLLSARWRKLIGLGAAYDLLAPGDAISPELAKRLVEERQLFMLYSARQKHPETPRLIRRPV